jgi:hypothetical protein
MKKNEDLRDIENTLNDLVEKLQNNYILIKNHVATYAKYFQELSIDFRSVKILNYLDNIYEIAEI